MRTYTPVPLLDLGLRRLTDARGVNSTDRIVARDVIQKPRPVDLPLFLRRQAQ